MPSATAARRGGCVKGGDHVHVAVAVKVHDDDHVDVNANFGTPPSAPVAAVTAG